MQFAYLGAAGAQLPELVEVSSSTVTNTASTTITFSSMNFGEPAADRYLIAMIINTDAIANTNSISDITISGGKDSYIGSGSSHGTANNVDINIGYCIRLTPTGTSGDVVATFTTTLATSGVTMCRLFTIYAPSGLVRTGASLDVLADGSGNLIGGVPALTNDLVLIAAAYEGATGDAITSTHGSNKQVTFWEGEVGTTTHGFGGKVYASLNNIGTASAAAANTDYTAGDSACLYAPLFTTH